MDIKVVWQNILEQLQNDMPQASFDTWVKDSTFEFFDSGICVIGARNTYARDWLSSRLTEAFERLLSVELGQTVRVRYVIAESNNSVDTEATGKGWESPSAVVVSNDGPDQRGDKEIVLSVEDYDSVYEQIVRPDRAVYLLGYFRRWLRELGPVLAWIYVAFRQLAYMTGARQGYGSGRFTGRQIAALSGISERTYWNRAEASDTWKKLAGLVKIADHGPQWDERSSTPKRLARRYAVAMTLPLTPADTGSLTKWIKQNIENCGGPEGVLRMAAEAPLEELIPIEATETSDAVTVRRLVRDLFEGGDLSNKLLDALASEIQNHIMPTNDQIKITLYFLENILPHLGSGPAWMLTILRDLCYANPDTGEVRNRVVVQGGYAEIAGWLGMTRAKSIWEWLHERYPSSHNEAGKFKNAVAHVYMAEIERVVKELDFSGQSRTFDVLLEEIPAEILEAGLTNPASAIFHIVLTRLSQSVADGATFSIGVAGFSEDSGALFSINVARFSEDIGATFSIGVAHFSEDIGAPCRVKTLNSLKPTLNSLTPPPTNTENRGAESTAFNGKVAVSLPSAWGLDRLLNINRVTAKKAKTLRVLNANGSAIVSWVLYAKGKDGTGINNPISYAISRLEIDPTGGAGGGYDQLASLPPQDLLDVIHTFAQGRSILDLQDGDQASRLWLDLMGRDRDTALGLLRLLMGEDAPLRKEVVTQSENWTETEDGVEIAINTSTKKI